MSNDNNNRRSSSHIPLDPSKISSIVADGDEMRRIDLEVSDVLSITRVQEVASTRLADLLTYHLFELDNDDDDDDGKKSKSKSQPILFVVGKGNNGANGIAAARHLVGRGRPNVNVLLGFPKEEMNEMSREQLKLYEHFGGTAPLLWTNNKNDDDEDDEQGRLLASVIAKGGIIVDGLLGTGISKPPRGVIKDIIEWINSNGTSLPVLALDVPSGLNHVTGEVLEPCIRAKWTYNFHILKTGQVVDSARAVIGELWTADTDLTYTAWEAAGVKTEAVQELFSAGPIRRVF